MNQPMTETDIGFVHLVEKIVVPIMVASVIGLATWMNHISTAQAEIGERINSETRVQKDNRIAIDEFKQKQAQIIDTLHATEKDVIEIRSYQKQHGEDINEIKQFLKSIDQKLENNRNHNHR